MRRKTGIIPEYDERIDGQITRILSGLELLSAQVEESLEPMAEQIREDVLQMVRILQRGKLTEALRADALEAECAVCDLRGLLQRIPEDAADLLTMKGYRLEAVPGGPVFGLCDREAASQMIWCLIGARAAAGSRHITLDARESQDGAYVTVTGDGADPGKNAAPDAAEREETARALAALQGGSLTVRTGTDGVCASVRFPAALEGMPVSRYVSEIIPGIPPAELELAGLEAEGEEAR